MKYLIIGLFSFFLITSASANNQPVEKQELGINEIHNVIIKGRRKKVGNVGDDVEILCKGKRGTCMVVAVLTSRVIVFDPETNQPEGTYYGEVSNTSNYTDEDGESVAVYLIETN